MVKNGLNIFSFTSGGMPVPLSRIVISTRSPRFLVAAARLNVLTTAHKMDNKCIVGGTKERKMAAISPLKLVAPANKKRTVGAPRRKRNAEYRSREHLTEREVERLIEAAKDNRWGHRDSTMVAPRL